VSEPTMFFALADSGDTMSLDIFDAIGASGSTPGISAADVRRRLATSRSARTIRVTLNSSGGMVTEGLAIYSLLREHPARVEVHVVGLAASIASVIAMAGDRITMATGSLLMVHSPWVIARGNERELSDIGARLRTMSAQMVSIYAARTGQPAARIERWMADESWFSAEEAVQHGFADAVVAPPTKTSVALALASIHPEAFRAAPAQIAASVRSRPDVEAEERREWYEHVRELCARVRAERAATPHAPATPVATSRWIAPGIELRPGGHVVSHRGVRC
jgi:ATP-dependent Clp protease protease subunit